MTKRNLTFAFAAVRLGIFTLVSVLVTAALVSIMGGGGLDADTEYRARFSSASDLEKGDDVRVAGVLVGQVSDVSLDAENRAMVTFDIDGGVPLSTQSEASVRYLNLIGDRYLALTDGERQGARLPAGATIGLDRTTPALSLTELFNGFQPLFQALQPDDVNELSMNLVRVLQGESGTIQDLLANTASFTNDLADRDQLIGEVIDNLTTLMGTVDGRRQELGRLITSLDDWFGQLADDREVIGSSLDSISQLSRTLSDLLTEARPLLKQDVAQLRRLLTILDKPENKREMDKILDTVPSLLAKETRIGVYGSWYNYYLCEFRTGVILPSALTQALPPDVVKKLTDIVVYSQADRCNDG